MGCCDNDKGCASKQGGRRKVPWFSLLLIAFILLVVFYWQ